MVERYGSEIKLTKKEQRRLSQNKNSSKLAFIEDLDEPVVASNAQESTSRPKSASKWEEIYG